MIPLITKFNSNSVLFDALGDAMNTYISMHHTSDYIYFLLNSTGDVTRYNTITEELSNFSLNYTNSIYSVVEYNHELYGFSGYDAKKFVGDTVIYIKDNNKLVQESYDGKINITLLSSRTEIRDFFIDDNYNYYVIHGGNKISKFTKERIRVFNFGVIAYAESVFNSLSVMMNNPISLFKVDFVKEYTDAGIKSYPIILGSFTNQNPPNSANQLFLAKIDEAYIGTTSQNQSAVSMAATLPLTATYYSHGDRNKLNYNLTNYDYLKNGYPEKDELVFKVVLQNVYNNKDKIKVRIPISTYLFKSEWHHFAFRLNGVDGTISAFIDGKMVQTVNIQRGQYIFQDILRESFNVGATYFHNDITLQDHLNQPKYYFINNAKIKQFKVYKKALTDNEIDFHVYNNLKMEDLVVSLPCDQRNELDGIERQFKLDISGNKSNKVNIIIKNSQITNINLQNKLKEILIDKMRKVLPITSTINNIEFR
jgi:hypothetical protein